MQTLTFLWRCIMPRGDGTGPNGAGRMTGICGFGFGVAAVNESEMLKYQAKYLSESLDAVNKKLAQLHTTT
jgi:hypothetical protein